MSHSTSLCVAGGDALSPLSCKLQSAGCSVVRAVLDLLTMPPGNQRLVGWLGNHLLSVAGQLGGGASDLLSIHTGLSSVGTGSFLAAVACAAILALRSMGAAAVLAIVTLILAFALTRQLPSDLIGSAEDVELLLISGLVAVSAAFRHAAAGGGAGGGGKSSAEG